MSGGGGRPYFLIKRLEVSLEQLERQKQLAEYLKLMYYSD